MFWKKKEKEEENFSEQMHKLREAHDSKNPYALGRREYDDMYGRLAKNVSAWRIVAFLMLLLLSVSVVVVLWMAQEIKVVPFIIQVDEHGYEIAIQPVEPSKITDDKVIIARLGDFITQTRSVYQDRPATMGLIVKAYDTIAAGSDAERKLNTFYNINNPLQKSYLVSVALQTIMRATPESNNLWQAEWSERSYSKGILAEEKFYRGMFETAVNSPTSMQEIMKNPLGIFITDFNVTERLSQ